MKVILNDNGDQIGTLEIEPFELSLNRNAPEGISNVFDGLGNETDADTAKPPINPEELAAERFDSESIKYKEQLARGVAERNGLALVDANEFTGA